MPVFRYKAATPGGEVIEGRMEAASQAAVVKRLQAEGRIPIRAVEEGEAAPVRAPRRLRLGRDRVRADDVAVLTLELATLLGAGLALDRALDLLASQSDREAVRGLLRRVHAAVRRGVDLSAALRAEGRVFSRFYVNMVRAGESSGALDVTLARLAEFLEQGRALRETLVSALVYPIILLVFAAVSISLILGFVVPRITEMFAEAGRELPAATRVVIALGGAVHDYWWVGVALVVAGYAYARARAADPAWRQRVDAGLLRLPVAGELIGKYEAARFARTLGTLLRSGVSLLGAIAIAREVVGNRVVAAAVDRVAASARAGQGVARPLLEAGVFPSLAAHLVQVGEQTGELDAMLVKLAEIYEREVESALKRAVAVLGPLLILVLGVMIAGIILSVLVAILSVNELAF